MTNFLAMSDAEKRNNHIVEMLLSHPQGEEVRATAHEITDIIYDVRSNRVFTELFEGEKTDQTTKETLRSLLKKLRTQVAQLLNKNMPDSDDDLYREIILPLVTRQIDRSA